MKLAITISGAKGLRDADAVGSSDCYCVCEVPGVTRKPVVTHVIDDTTEPQWDYRGVLSDYKPGDPLEFTVWDKDSGGKKELLGKVTLESKKFIPGPFDGEVELEEGRMRQKPTLAIKIATLRAAKEDKPTAKPKAKSKTEFSDDEWPDKPPTPRESPAMRKARRPPRSDYVADIIAEGEAALALAPEPVPHTPLTGEEWKLSQAVIKVQRWWRAASYSWISSRLPVRLPPSAEDMPELIPEAMVAPPVRRGARGTDREVRLPKDPTWHARLVASARAVMASRDSNMSKRCAVQLQHMQEVGRFVAACRAAAVLAAHALIHDPHGTFPYPLANDDDPWSNRLPRRVLPTDPLWPHVHPRFDADRIFVQDSIVMTIIGGSFVNIVDTETAWRIYSHDAASFQALADIIMAGEWGNPLVPPVLVVVDYMGFRILCRPQVLFIGQRPAELVIGPLVEAHHAYSGPGDLPEQLRATTGTGRVELSLLVNSWEEAHQELRLDLETIAKSLRVQGLPVVLDASDLPENVESTAVVRANGELHFRTPAELLPPEILTDAGLADPSKRLRREALDTLGTQPLPMTHRMSAYASDGGGGGMGTTRLLGFSLLGARELPRRLLERLELEGPPLDSRGWTEALHSAGINCRHIGWVTSGAPPSVAASLHREAIARSLKWIFRYRLWSRLPWAAAARQNTFEAALGPEVVATRELLSIFNLALGSGKAAMRFWNHEVIPETMRRFGVASMAIERGRVSAGGLFFSMQHHLRVKFRTTANHKYLHHDGVEEPFAVDDLLPFRSAASQSFFPHLPEVLKRLDVQRRRHGGQDDFDLVPGGSPTGRSAGRVVNLRGFVPEARLICARGPEWALAVQSPARHVKDARWDRAYEALNLRLSMSRALGDPAAVVAVALQGIAVSLLKLAKSLDDGADQDEDTSAQHYRALKDSGDEGANSPGAGRQPAKGKGVARVARLMDSRKTLDADRARHALWAADLARRLMPNSISAWWSQLAALEAEYLLDRPVAAETRMQRLNGEWDRFASDQPILQLKLQDTLARLLARNSDWVGAAHQLERCCRLAEHAFGRSHPATVSYLARLGDSWVRQEQWQPAVQAFRQALALCQALGDQAAAARVGYELANALHRSGDAAAAKAHAESVVWSVLPRLHAGADGVTEITAIHRTPGGAFALDALYLLARIYEDIFLRACELQGGAGLTLAEQREVAMRSIQCYEALLRQLPVLTQRRNPNRASREGLIVESILRLKTLTTGVEERTVLEDAIEALIVSSSLAQDRSMKAMKGVRALQPKIHTHAIAAAALRTSSDELQGRVLALCEAVAKDAAFNGLSPSEWFDRIVQHLSGGAYWGLTELHDPKHQATLQLLDLCRHFMGDSRAF